MKSWKKRIFSPRMVIGVLAIIALAFTVIACKEEEEVVEDDPYGRGPYAPKGVIFTLTNRGNMEPSNTDYTGNLDDYTGMWTISYQVIISWTGVPGSLQYYVFIGPNHYTYYPIPIVATEGDVVYSAIGVVTEAAYGNNAYSYTYTGTYTSTGAYSSDWIDKLVFKVSAVNSWGRSPLSEKARRQL